MLQHEFRDKEPPVEMLWNLMSYQYVKSDVSWAKTLI